jgi:hypothetical protein
MGVINLELQNQALLLKQLHKFFCKADIRWVKLIWSSYSSDSPPHTQSRRGSFWWKDVFSLIDIYRSITSCEPGSGNTVIFWKDFWLGQELLCDKFPWLHSYALNEDVSVAKFAQAQDPFSLFALPLSTQAFHELAQLWEMIQPWTLTSSEPNVRTFAWGSKNYTSSRFYKFMFGAFPEDVTLSGVWKSKCLPKLRVFAWLLLLDRLNTKDIMQRKN